MRILTIILAFVFTIPLSAQKWERLDETFQKHLDNQEYYKAGEAAVKEVNYALENLDSTDIRYITSYFNLAQAYHKLGSYEDAKLYLGTSYNLLIPFYAKYSDELANVSELYGRLETELGFHESAFSYLSYARDMRAALYGKESYAYITSLYFLAELEMARAEWEQMVTILVEALEQHERHHPKNHDFARYANFLGLIYMNNGGNQEAAETFEWALTAYGVYGIEKNITHANLSNNLGLANYYMSDFENAALNFENADSGYQVLLEGYSENYMMLQNNLASLYYSWDKPDLTREAYMQLEAYLEAYPRSTDLNYIQACENAATYHAGVGELKSAEKYYKRAIDIRRNADSPDHRELAGGFLLLASLYEEGGRPELAIETTTEAYDMLLEVCEPGDPNLVLAITFLGYYHQQSDQPNRALYYYGMAREQVEFSENTPGGEESMLYNNMGVLFLEQDRMNEAIPCLEIASQLDPDDPTVLYNLGYAYSGTRNPEVAREMFNRAKVIYGDLYGIDHPDYAGALIMGVKSRAEIEDLGEDDLADIVDAERIFIEFGIDTVDARFIETIDAYRLYFNERREYKKALDYGERVLALSEKESGRNSQAYAINLLRQTVIYSRLGDLENLDRIYKDIARIASSMEKEAGDNLLYVAESSRYSNYYYLEEYEEARKSMEWVIGKDKARFLEHQGFMTQQERSNYSRSLTSLVDYNDYLFHFPGDQDVIINAVNNRLFVKSILLDAERRQKKALSETADTTLIKLTANYTDKKLQLSNQRSEFGVDNLVLDSLQEALLTIEKEISRRLAEEMALSERSYRWEEVRDALDEDEAAVEVILFFHTTAPPVRTAHPWYFAFVITPEMENHPLCIRLYDAMEVLPEYESYRGAVESVSDEPMEAQLYDGLWAKIDSAVSGKKRVYFSPDGIFHTLNVEALVDRSGRYVVEKYEVKHVYTLSDLLREKRVYGENRLALLAGDPLFRMSQSSNRDPLLAENTRELNNTQTRMFPGTHLSALPGTRTEVDSIGSMLQKQGWDFQGYTGPNATEDAIVSTENPRVLHLATHGFFAQNEIQVFDTITKSSQRSYNYQDADNQSRSCLFLAGAQNTLFYAYDYSKGQSDGILTSWEISEMKLDSTELVVLSACETGMGDILDSEGVTGLRRAFHLAGAQRIMISLWEVDDNATQLLMREFYSNWLSGMDMDISLADAKKYLMTETEYSHPRYWAGFILSGI